MTTIKQEFLLDPQVTFLNHGSFGATPKPVFKAYQYWQRELENQPVEFLGRRANDLLMNSRTELAHFLGTEAGNIVYVTNATVGVNVVARSLNLGPGDEVLASNHEYGALDRTWRFLAEQKGFSYRNQPIPLPVNTPGEVVEQFWSAVTPSTKVIFLSHITSPTALIFPVEEICDLARQNHILTIVDGAHTPGQLNINLDQLNADFYIGNLHKWLCAPKGAAFLFAHPRVQHLIQPLVVSWGWQSDAPGPYPWIDYLEWQGTRDISAFLAVPEAIRFQEENNWGELQEQCFQLLVKTCVQVNRITGLAPISPFTPTWIRQMAACRLPRSVDVAVLKSELYDRFRIEVPIFSWNDEPLIRISIQAYNSKSDSQKLIDALSLILSK